MYPVLFKIGWFEAHSYGLLLMGSFLAGIYLGVWRAKKTHVDPNQIIDISIVLIISGIVGSRGLYVLFHLEEFRGQWLNVINPFQSDGSIGIAGLTVLGGIILSIFNSIIYLRYKKIPLLPIFNIMAPSLALGFVFTRIGCYLHGCCYGTPLSSGWSVVFPANSPAGFQYPGQQLHPAQIYASFAGAINFTLLILSEKITFFKDKTFFSFLILYGISRFIVDIFRYYEESMVILNVSGQSYSLNQGISILLVAGGAVGIYILSKKPEQIRNK